MYKEYKKILQERLDEKRYFHSLCVADEAKRLAEKYGGNEEKCYLAGLLHDITKNASYEEHFSIFKDTCSFCFSVRTNPKSKIVFLLLSIQKFAFITDCVERSDIALVLHRFAF